MTMKPMLDSLCALGVLSGAMWVQAELKVAKDRSQLHADYNRYLRAFKVYVEPQGYRVTF